MEATFLDIPLPHTCQCLDIELLLEYRNLGHPLEIGDLHSVFDMLDTHCFCTKIPIQNHYSSFISVWFYLLQYLYVKIPQSHRLVDTFSAKSMQTLHYSSCLPNDT